MKKFNILLIIFIVPIGLHFSTSLKASPIGIDTDSVNLALIALPTTSFVSDWESIDAVNDGYTPSNSNDKAHGAYGNWSNPNSFQWVQYDWNSNYLIKSVEIYWFDDNGGVLTPTEAYIEYYENSDWVRSSDVPCNKDSFNWAELENISTNKIRVTMLNPTQSTGILEFRVWGSSLSGGTDIESPTTPGTPEIISKSDTSVYVTWTASVDNDSIGGYQVLINDSAFVSVSDTFASITGLTPNTNYLLSINAYDVSQNFSESSPSIWIHVGPDSSASAAFNWPSYSPTLNYDFRDEFPSLAEPTMDLDDCPQVVGTQSSGWWTFKWGPNARSVVTEAAITPLLERLNEDFAFFRDSLGWPPDKRAREGYRSAVYLYGSGLSCIDNADSSALGGWQSSVGGYACILASYYPVYSFDPACPYSDKEFQKGAMVHEGIHSILADMPGVKKAAWFHEGGNTWLQQEMESRKSNDYGSMGFLNAGAFIAPFMPIECYSGWLQDGSFGGPSAEGVNRFDGNTQICTWRNLLGGNQYGNGFPSAISTILGDGCVAWIWRYSPGRVLEGMAGGLGDMQMRRLLMEYRAKQALVDMDKWSGAVKNLMDANFNSTIRAEWSPKWINCTNWKATPYVKTWMTDSTLQELSPEPRTTPGWSGANQIPLNVTGDTVGINFIPLGKNLTCQICYRAIDGTPIYGNPVSSGYCSLALDKEPANGVVIVVVTNTNYVYEGEKTRMAHYDYRIQLKKGVSGKASVYKKWYDYNSVIVDQDDPVEPFPTEGPIWVEPVDPPDTTYIDQFQDLFSVNVYPNPIGGGQIANVEFNTSGEDLKTVKIYNMRGQLIFSKQRFIENQLEIPITSMFFPGIYFINAQTDKQSCTFKLLVN